MLLRSILISASFCLTAAFGCASSTSPSAYESFSDRRYRNSLRAQELNEQGLSCVRAGDYAKAEEYFRKALEADLFYAPAHNNLGLTLLQAQPPKPYESAWEFQYAAKLTPHSAEPRNNLGLVFEHVGRLEDAEKWYAEALEIEPQNIEVMGHLARVYVKANKKSAKLKDLLAELAYRGEGGWDQWATEQLLKAERE